MFCKGIFIWGGTHNMFAANKIYFLSASQGWAKGDCV